MNKSISLQQAYTALSLAAGSSWPEIQERYRDLILVWHPDRFDKPSQRQKAEKELQRINQARDQLKLHFRPGIHNDSPTCSCRPQVQQLRPAAERKNPKVLKFKLPHGSERIALVGTAAVFLLLLIVMRPLPAVQSHTRPPAQPLTNVQQKLPTVSPLMTGSASSETTSFPVDKSVSSEDGGISYTKAVFDSVRVARRPAYNRFHDSKLQTSRADSANPADGAGQAIRETPVSNPAETEEPAGLENIVNRLGEIDMKLEEEAAFGDLSPFTTIPSREDLVRERTQLETRLKASRRHLSG